MGRPKGSKSKRPSPLKGKTYEELYGHEEGSRRRDLCRQTHKTPPKGSKVKESTRKLWKENGRIGGIRHGAGRGKKGWYEGIWCDSSWELAYVVWCKDHDISIERNKTAYPYIDSRGACHRYYPDFRTVEGLVEVKGYLSEDAKRKIEQCPEKVSLIAQKEIVPYLEYAIQKCNCEDITVLYSKISLDGSSVGRAAD